MICPKCNNPNIADARFCKFCGNALTAPAQSVYSPTAQPSLAQSFSTPQLATPFHGQSGTPPIITSQPNSPGLNTWNDSTSLSFTAGGSVRRLTRIKPRSAFKMAATIYGLIYSVLGLFGLLISILMIVLGASSDFLPAEGRIVSLIILLLGYIFGVLAVAVFAGISAAIGAWVYNLVARRIGGIEIEVA
ncbi:MAG: hypothetical protein ABTQ25_14565 [Nitrosomonas ureae]